MQGHVWGQAKLCELREVVVRRLASRVGDIGEAVNAVISLIKIWMAVRTALIGVLGDGDAIVVPNSVEDALA